MRAHAEHEHVDFTLYPLQNRWESVYAAVMLIDTDDMVPATTFNRTPGKYVDVGAEGGRPIIVKDNVPVAFVGSLDDLRRLQAFDNVDPTTFAFTGPAQMPKGRWGIGQDPGGGRVWVQVASHILTVGERREVLDLAVSAALGTWLQGADAPTELLIGTAGFVSPVIWHGQTTPPKVRGVVVDLDDKTSASRLTAQIRSQFEARKQLMIRRGFPSLGQYRTLLGEEAVPDLVVAAQLAADAPHRELAAVLKQVVRRGPELGMYLWLFSDGAPEWLDPEDFPQRIAFGVRSALTSRQLVGTTAASLLPPHSTDGYLQTPELQGVCRFSLQPADLDREAGYQLDKLGDAGRSVMDEPLALARLLAEHEPADDVPYEALSWPIGYSDDPLASTNHLKYFSTKDGSQSFVGRPGSGTSTVLQTVLLSAASLYSPAQVGFYVINCGGHPLAEVEDLPHVGAVGHNTHEDTRIVETLHDLVHARQRIAADHEAYTKADFQRLITETPELSDGYPMDMILMVDRYGKFRNTNTSPMYPSNPLCKSITDIARLGSKVGINVVASADRATDLGVDLLQLVTPWEFKLLPSDVSAIHPPKQTVQPASLIPDAQPGRGIDHHGNQVRFAMCGTDTGTHAMVVSDMVQDIAERFTDDRPVPGPKLLPTQVDSGSLATWEPSGERYAIGIAERDLQPAVVDFNATPLMVVYGDPGSGRKEFIAHMLDAITHQHPSITDAIVIVVDLQRQLGDAIACVTRDATADFYVTDARTLSDRLDALYRLFSDRRPPSDLSPEQLRHWKFEGPKVYLVIEDLAQLPKNLSNRPALLFEPLREFIPTARNVGLRIIAGSGVKNITNDESMPGLQQWMNNAGTNTLMLRAQSGARVMGWAFERDTPNGRALWVDSSRDSERVQLAGQESADARLGASD